MEKNAYCIAQGGSDKEAKKSYCRRFFRSRTFFYESVNNCLLFVCRVVKGGDSMAVNKVPDSSRMLIAVQTGVSADGKAVVKNRTFSNIKPAAVDADVFAIGTAMAALQADTFVGVLRDEVGRLISNP